MLEHLEANLSTGSSRYLTARVSCRSRMHTLMGQTKRSASKWKIQVDQQYGATWDLWPATKDSRLPRSSSTFCPFGSSELDPFYFHDMFNVRAQKAQHLSMEKPEQDYRHVLWKSTCEGGKFEFEFKGSFSTIPQCTCAHHGKCNILI